MLFSKWLSSGGLADVPVTAEVAHRPVYLTVTAAFSRGRGDRGIVLLLQVTSQ